MDKKTQIRPRTAKEEDSILKTMLNEINVCLQSYLDELKTTTTVVKPKYSKGRV